MKIYRLPLKSRIALRIYNLLPTRVQAWGWITAYDDLDDERNLRDVEEDHVDGSRSFYRAVSEIRIENLRRKLYYDHLKATTIEK